MSERKKKYWEMDRPEKRELLAERQQKYGGLQHILDLDEKYPEAGLLGIGCIGADVQPGWASLLDPCLEVIQRLGCRVTQAKQKFGVLTVYWDGPPWLQAANEAWFASSKVGPDPADSFREVKMVIDLMAHRSKFTCEACGSLATEGRGQPISGVRICDKCREEKNAQLKA